MTSLINETEADRMYDFILFYLFFIYFVLCFFFDENQLKQVVKVTAGIIELIVCR